MRDSGGKGRDLTHGPRARAMRRVVASSYDGMKSKWALTFPSPACGRGSPRSGRGEGLTRLASPSPASQLRCSAPSPRFAGRGERKRVCGSHHPSRDAAAPKVIRRLIALPKRRERSAAKRRGLRSPVGGPAKPPGALARRGAVCERTLASRRSTCGSRNAFRLASAPVRACVSRRSDSGRQRAPRTGAVVPPGRVPKPPECELVRLARRNRILLRLCDTSRKRPSASRTDEI